MDRILQGKDFHILTTNQDITVCKKIYPGRKGQWGFRGGSSFLPVFPVLSMNMDAICTTCGRYDCGYGRGTMVPDED